MAIYFLRNYFFLQFFFALFLASEYYLQEPKAEPRRQLCFTGDPTLEERNDLQKLSTVPPCGIQQRLQANAAAPRYRSMCIENFGNDLYTFLFAPLHPLPCFRKSQHPYNQKTISSEVNSTLCKVINKETCNQTYNQHSKKKTPRTS